MSSLIKKINFPIKISPTFGLDCFLSQMLPKHIQINRTDWNNNQFRLVLLKEMKKIRILICQKEQKMATLEN